MPITSVDVLRRIGRELPLLVDSPEAWEEKALCSQTDPEIFFPDTGGSTREAMKVCNRCEVTVQCLQKALDDRDQHGVRGAKTPTERAKMLRARGTTW